MVLMQNVDAINARSETISVLRLPLRNNPLLMAGVGVALGLHVVAMYMPWLQAVLAVHAADRRRLVLAAAAAPSRCWRDGGAEVLARGQRVTPAGALG